ncbi:hypothetical protein C8R43DRAFT_1129285 [Mycena crocata]|nr:hypothetical protein C8R43DRAFT_1129285 [Mycena crocata]
MHAAKYPRDFVPVRQSSSDGGSNFVFKQVPDMVVVDGRTKGYLANYVGIVFGYLDGVFVVGASSYTRLRCPPGAACSVLSMYKRQLELLGDVLDVDKMHMKGDIAASWLDNSAVHMQMAAMPGCFYVKGDIVNWAARYMGYKAAMIQVSLTMTEHEVGTSDDVLSRMYSLDVLSSDLHDDAYFPRRGNNCDVDEVRGCEHCSGGV